MEVEIGDGAILCVGRAKVPVTDKFVCIIHESRVSADNINSLGSTYASAKFIVISGGSLQAPTKLLKNVFYYPHPVSKRLKDDPFTIRFRAWYTLWHTGQSSRDWSPLTQNPAPLFALRLLCEAWRETGGADSTVRNGVTIYAPTKLSDWLVPFEASSTEDVLKLITDPSLKGKAEAVLKSAVTGNAMKDSITAFLGACVQ